MSWLSYLNLGFTWLDSADVSVSSKSLCNPQFNSVKLNFDTFHIPKSLLTCPQTKFQSTVPLENTNNVQHFINSIMNTDTNKSMIVFMEVLTHLNSGPTVTGVIIKKQGPNSTPPPKKKKK